MSQLTEQYKFETGDKAMYRMKSSDYHTLRYVKWLEDKVEKFTSTNNARDEICSCPAGKKLLGLESIVHDGIKFCTHCGGKLSPVA